MEENPNPGGVSKYFPTGIN
ncbi:hypothetical protein VTO73DRAFT_4236 [Trametes versicolor]